MKDKAVVFVSLAVALGAFGHSVWVHHHSEQMAERALQKREREFVRTFAPRIRSVYAGMGVTNEVSRAETLDELFGPYVEVLSKMVR